MGTNYYWNPTPCPTCGHSEELHIGKSSGGWVFALRAYPDIGINDLPDWEEKWTTGTIRDEYGGDVTPGHMRLVITERKWQAQERSPEFLRQNHAEPGPNGLLRASLNEEWGIIRHGEGTWDIHVQEFS